MKPKKKLTNPYQSVEASDLGEGRHRTELFVSYSEVPDARMAQHLKKTEVVHNWPSCNEVRLQNREVYEISSKSIGGIPVSLFLRNDSTEYLWFLQEERHKIMIWLQIATPGDKFAFAESLVEKTGSGRKPCPPAWGSFLNRDLSLIEIEKLDLLHLRDFTAMIHAGHPEFQAADAR